MGLFSSRKKEVPKIRSSMVLPELSRQETTISNLPSIPAGNIRDNLNEEMIKSAVNDYDESLEEEVDEMNKQNQNSEWNKRQLPSLPTYKKSGQNTQPQKDTIFVKIDKYRISLEALNEIEEQIKELSSEISTLKETKIKEIKELTDWDEELKKINSKLSRIDVNIFGEV